MGFFILKFFKILAMNFNYKNEKIDIYPLFGDLLSGEPYIFDFSSKNPKTIEYNLNDFKEFNDDGEWVSARFTTASDEIYEEWYYIIDGKLSWWGSAKRGLYTE